MDDRHLAFLARQPSAALKPRESFWGMSKRGLAFILVNAIFWQPLLVQAEGIVVSGPSTSLGVAGNGVPIVNIAAPNNSGLSHNQFSDYNVGANGVILNNATDRTQSTQLGGLILGNPNLQGTAANIILNEVNGTSPSQLRGYTEVAGQSAKVIVANPYGITCNGCGFINTPNVTLTTGKPILDNGRLDRYQVDGGAVTIDGQGLNASNVDRFEIITRSAKINAQINARNLTVIAGRNDVNAQTLNATARADDGSAKPELAIDSSALGGMYAGAIKLVGTEAGVGVKLDGTLAASGGDIQLDANGHLSLAQAAASGAVKVRAGSIDAQRSVYAGTALEMQARGDLNTRKNLAARDSIQLSSGGLLTNHGIIEAGVNADNTRTAAGDVSLSAQTFNNMGNSVVASRNLNINAAHALNNQGGNLSAIQAANISAGTLNNRGATLTSLGTLNLKAGAVDNSAEGRIASNQTLTVHIASLNNNAGQLTGFNGLTLDVNNGQLSNRSGLIRGATLALNNLADVDNRGGEIASGQGFTLAANSLDNTGGRLLSDQGLTLRLDQSLVNVKGLISASGLDARAGSLNNTAGTLTSSASLLLELDGALDNREGEVSSASATRVQASSLDNRQNGKVLSDGSLSTRISGLLDNQSNGSLTAKGAMDVQAGSLDNRGGLLSGVGPVRLNAQTVENARGRIASKSDLTAFITHLNQQQGELVAQGALSLTANTLDNSNGGLIGASKTLTLNVDDINNQGAEISSAAELNLAGTRLNNSNKGKLLAGTDLGLKVAHVINQSQSLLFGKDTLKLQGRTLDNSGGTISGEQELSLTLSDYLNNRGGTLNAKGAVSVTTGTFDNTDAGSLISNDTLALMATNVSNGAGSRIASGKAMTVSVMGFEQNGGQLFSNTSLSLDLNNGQLNNQHGLINAPLLMLKNLNGVNNQSGEISSDRAFTLVSKSLDNSNGRLISNQALTLRVERALNNVKGQIAAAALHVYSASLDNSEGLLSSAKELGVTVEGDFNNHYGLLISDGNVRLVATRLNNNDGQLFSKGDFVANITQVTNQNGTLTAQGTLGLSGERLDNSNGRLISQKDLALDLSGELNNNQGRLSSEGLLAVNAGSLNNRLGSVSSAGALSVSSTGAVDNQGGELVTDASFTLNSARLDNSQNGTLSSTSALSITTGAFDNSHAGNVSSSDTLDINATQLINQSGGRLTSDKALTANITGLDQQGGKLFSNTSVELDLNHGQLNNQSGLINGPRLMLKNLKDVNNQAGEISSAQSFILAADHLDNSGGKLLSHKALILRMNQALANVKGLISAQSIDGRAASLDNSGGTFSSRGDLLLNLDGQLSNHNQGLISAADTLTLHSSGLNNNSGSVLGKSIAIDLGRATGDLNNAAGLIATDGLLTFEHLRDLNNQGGEISTAQRLTLNGRTLDNSSGKVISNNWLTLGGIRFINQGGLISGWQGLSVSGSDLDNRNQGTLSSRYGDVDVALSNSLLNSSAGALVSQKNLSVRAANLDNSDKGILSSAGEQTLNVTGLLNNVGGTVSAQQALSLIGTTLDNSGGSLIGNGDMTLDLLGALINTNGKLASAGGLLLNRASEINNQGGQLTSQGLLSLFAGSLDNRNRGTVAANDALVVSTTGAVQNSSDGLIFSQRGDLNLKSASLDNQAGRITAQTGDTVITTGAFDNRNGSLYVKGSIKVTGTSFDNSGDAGGQVAGRYIDLNFSRGLNNQKGIIESDTTLSIGAQRVDNRAGQLRALGTSGKTEFQIGTVFDNRNGLLETANHDLTFNADGFQNAGGNVLHVGSGRFDVSTANLTNVGGSLVTRGDLTLTADHWTNSSVIQAGRLTVNVNTLNQTVDGQLLASDSWVGSGSHWNNAGLMASDGRFDLALAGTFTGTGRISSVGDLSLTAGQLTLSDTGSIASGRDAAFNIAGEVNNYGRLTSAADLNLTAGTVNNYGTFGSGQKLTATTGALLNDHALMFSGSNMSLRVDSLTNHYADIYSLGNLSIDRDGNGKLANSIINRSSTLQSDSNLSLAASTIHNIRAVLNTSNQGIYTARIGEIACIEGVNAGDCGGKRNHVWEIVQRDKFEVTEASAASSIISGGNLSISGVDLLNQSSTIAAAGNLSATVNNLVNSGIETGETETTRVFLSERTKNADNLSSAASTFSRQYWFQSTDYTPNDVGGLEAAMGSFIGMMEREWPQFKTTQNLAVGDQYYAAVIQAGGAVSVSAGNNIDNSVVRAGYTYVGSGSRTDTNTPGAESSTRITLNPQLPPDLAQQQVNPLSLPGFSLPAGDKGLFRLSGQGAATPALTGSESWTMGSAAIGTAQREHTLPGDGSREVQAAMTAPAADLSSSVAGNATALNVDSFTGASMPARSDVGGVAPAAPVEELGASPGGLSVNRVQTLPDSSYVSSPQKYLIETNPALTDLKQFMSSDYLLSNLGYNPDQSQKRLGDGLYEQRLIQQAVIARTGQRYIDGQTSDAGMYRYLMDNAIASKQQLNLSVGVSLTSEQVAALTHDIVWMESATVDGQHVLVPVLYLAQANNRLGPTGALITGNDINLIAGKDLNNVGTLRATNNLSAKAGADLANSGLIEAGNRLDLRVGNNLTNKSGGIIAGRDVSLTAVNGDVINERTVTRHQSSSGYRTEQSDFVDNAARIEAANNLSIQAGRDVSSVGGVLNSGADTTLKAGRDVNLIAAEQRNANAVTDLSRSNDVSQHGSVIETGRDFRVQAGRDISAIASEIDAKRNIAMSATGDLTLASGADEQHSASKSKKVKTQEDHISQVSTVVTAGGDVTLSAERDLTLIASRVNAGDEAYLVAGGNLALLAAQDS
uniref:two-partner secretion domain-containing protein n=1 Tax=Pseudomonas psychrophila TaxID=122355 RepID=UPI000378610E